MAALDGDRPFYNIAVGYRISGRLDVAALRTAVMGLAARHEMLRATFHMVEGQPTQRIARAVEHAPEMLVSVVDRSSGHASEPDDALCAAAAHVFDLETGPLWRLTVVRLGPMDHQLALVMHHIISDGWTFELFLKELSERYAAIVQDAAPPDYAPPPGYVDLADKQRADLEGARAAAMRESWRRRLEGTIPPLALPQDRFSAGYGDRSAAPLALVLDRASSDGVAELVRVSGSSAFMVLTTALSVALHARTCQTDMLIVTPVTGRHKAKTRETLGYFNNILPLRLDLSGDPSLTELLGRVRETTLEAYRGQDIPTQWLAGLPSLRRVSLSRMLVSLDMEWPPRFSLAGLETEAAPIDTGTADFDLSLSLWQADDLIKGTLRYKTALFDARTAETLSSDFRKALSALVARPDSRLSDVRDPFSAPSARSESGAEREPTATADKFNLPRSAVEAELAQIWETAFDRRPIVLDDSLQALGASSLVVAELVELVRERFDVALPLPQVFAAGTLGGMAELLLNASPDASRSALAPLRPEGALPPLFLFEGVGIYYPALPYLDPDRPVFGLVTQTSGDMPGVEALAASYVEQIIERAPDPERPVHLGGVSFGGLVAFEAARQLRARNRRVGVLALIDTPGPEAYRRKGLSGRVLGHARKAWRFGPAHLMEVARRRLPPRTRRTDRVEARDRAAPRTIRQIFMENASSYAIRPYEGDLLVFKLRNPEVEADALLDPYLGRIDPLLGWGAVAPGRVSVVEMSGGHVGMLTEPHVAVLGRALADAMASKERTAV